MTTMIALQHKESIQRNHEAAVKCLKSKGFIFNRHKGSSVEKVPELKDERFVPPGSNHVEPNSTVFSESVAPANEFPKSPPYSPSFGSWPNFHPYSKHMQYWQQAVGNQICPYPVDTRLQYMRFGNFSQGFLYENQLQDFQYFVVIDFEATCEEGRIPNPQEIIEFPSVIVNGSTGQLEACFQTYVRPTCNQNLSDFCKDLTGIEQSQVDRGLTLSEALVRHDEWLERKGLKNGNFAVVTWSNWDCRVMLESECQYKRIHKPHYFNRWINLKIPFQHVFGGRRFITLKEAVDMSGLKWEGRPHSGLDDAKNTARLLSLLMRKGFKFSITGELEGSPHQQTPSPHPQPISPHQQPLSPHQQPALPHQQTPSTHLQPISPHQQPISPHQQPALPHQHPMMFQFYPCCLCGVKSKRGRVHKPGPKLGSVFFSCGNWTPARGNLCPFFQWASP